MKDILTLTRIQIVLIALFVIFKLIRPSVLNSDSPEIFKTILLSLPNFFEGVIGTLVLTGFGLYLNSKLKKKFTLPTVYLAAVILATIFVTTQELKIHNLGGNNIYDPNDLIFSGLGLLLGYLFVRHIKPEFYNE